jgi:hypothetical protein
MHHDLIYNAIHSTERVRGESTVITASEFWSLNGKAEPFLVACSIISKKSIQLGWLEDLMNEY